MSITAQQAMEQSADSAEFYLRTGARRLDDMFGEGFAKGNPSLVGQFAIAASIDYLAWSVKSSREDVSLSVSTLAEVIDDATNLTCATIGEKLEAIADNIPVV